MKTYRIKTDTGDRYEYTEKQFDVNRFSNALRCRTKFFGIKLPDGGMNWLNIDHIVNIVEKVGDGCAD